MSDTNRIGLHEASASQLAEKLNELLANYQIFYMNVRGYHWNVKGPQFFQLHEKFEELYTDLL
ncbi:MAG: Dps family protein, partial [Halomonas sp.]